MMLLSTWKALASISVDMSGLEPKTALAMVITPGFWLLRPTIAIALPFAYIFLVMNEADREDKDITLVEDL